jgi:flagellar biosynthesis protein
MSRQQAVALEYHEGLYAPRVVAKGSGAIAEEIIRRAEEAGVYVHASADLVQLLMRVDLDDHIPPVLYLAVAEILAWVRRLDPATTQAHAQPPVDPPA